MEQKVTFLGMFGAKGNMWEPYKKQNVTCEAIYEAKGNIKGHVCIKR